MTHRLDDPSHIDAAADAIQRGDIVGFFFNGAYALLGDADRSDAADRIFTLKRRPRDQTLSLVADPRFWPEFVALQDACRARGIRAMLGASANPSGEPTYTTADQMERGFGPAVPIVFAEEPELDPARRNSTSLLDLTGDEPTLLREGNTSEAEVRAAVADAGLGRLVVAPEVVRL